MRDSRYADRQTAGYPTSLFWYLRHTQQSVPIRQIAREVGMHASTIQRQIRRIEAQRDDALFDEAIRRMARNQSRRSRVPAEDDAMNIQNPGQKLPDGSVTDPEFEREATRILRRLAEPGACLASAADMENAVVVRDTADGRTIRTAVTSRANALELALRDWVVCTAPGRVSRYRITNAGRGALKRMLAKGSRQEGFSEQHREWEERAVGARDQSPPTRTRFNTAESPVSLLARRKSADGTPFLTVEMAQAAERLREDFELAQLGPRVGQNWERFLTGSLRDGSSGEGAGVSGSETARKRVQDALAALGPGLADVALRVCCFLEGVECAEKRLGWSARSGKVVLRIALQRLDSHYREAGASDMIG